MVIGCGSYERFALIDLRIFCGFEAYSGRVKGWYIVGGKLLVFGWVQDSKI